MQDAGPIGPSVNTDRASPPQRVVLSGSYVTVAPLSAGEHGDALWNGTGGPHRECLWRYLSEGPFPSREPFDELLRKRETSADPFFYALIDPVSRQALGMAALMRIEPMHRVVEVGSILYTDALQRTRAATEAMYLLARYVFESLHYRRYEWKCNALNEPSRSAALRLGFTFEGVFRQHMIIKGRNRDTAWFSMLDGEWPKRKAALEEWLDPSNFDGNGDQRKPLGALER
jgi:RimJ/RimL family protein N-acetyltransferase